MRKTILYIIFLMFLNRESFAHQPEQSILIISQTEDGKYMLQLNSGLSAFEGEINYLYPQKVYKTPEEFKKLVIDHIIRNVSFILNGKDTLTIKNPMLLLGHGTHFIAELAGVQSKINSIAIRNHVFKEIPRNECVFILLIKGVPEKHFLLNQENAQEINLKRKENMWNKVEKKTFWDEKITPWFRSIYLEAIHPIYATFIILLLLIVGSMRLIRQLQK